MKQNLKWLTLLVSVMLIAACASTPKLPEQSLEERSQARWDHIFAGEAAEALEYYTPGYRQVTSVADYAIWLRTRPVRWTSATVRDSDCESDDKCKVSVNVSYRVPGGPTGINNMRMTSVVEENWIRLDRGWFYVHN